MTGNRSDLNHDCCVNDGSFDMRRCRVRKKLVGDDWCYIDHHNTVIAPHRERRMYAQTGVTAHVCALNISKPKIMLLSGRRRNVRRAAAVLPLNPETPA
jgi:hypothetical protein